MTTTNTFIQLSYLLGASLFIFGLKFLSSPATARKGNMIGASGMAICIIATFFYLDKVQNYPVILGGILIGSTIGYLSARFVKMTAMPEMVGLLNGWGGGASTLVAVAEFWRIYHLGGRIPFDTNLAILLSILIGGVTLTGSVTAFGKLQEIVPGRPVTFPLQQPLNALLFIVFLAGAVYLLTFESRQFYLGTFLIILAVALILGILFVLPIGGADMPVVISLLNSFSGLAAAMTGFVIKNNGLIISGALVGASGMILSMIMCKAMNRSLMNVLFGAFGTGVMAPGAVTASGKTVRTVDAEEAAMILGYSRKVAIVPGYGMAAAQAQHAVRELADELEKRGVEVKYAIHPVAGRMPGHMNVLLAEANVPYDQLYEMDDINPEFPEIDVALVIGANDVVNPAARNTPGSPIYGMPILNVDQARHVIVIKRSLNPGFAGIDNELFYLDRTMMLFGSAREKVKELTSFVKELA